VPNIPTYERQAGAQQLGGTAKLSASVDAGAPMKALAGGLGTGAQILQQRDQMQKQKDQIKDQGFADQAEISRQQALNQAEVDWTADQVGGAPTMSIEQKPEFMRKRMEGWTTSLNEGWKGTEGTLSEITNASNLKLEREQTGYQAEVTGFELERAVVSKEMALNNAVYTQDAEATKRHFAQYEQLAGPEKAAQAGCSG